jgi:hypothetical protein
MAVYQIARIQVRRGKAKSGTGIPPQLASGELAWAVDTQELYIGNGSVAEGAPGVGNTRMLTEHDLGAEGNILQILQYAYRANDATISTSPGGSVFYRPIQNRMDDQIVSADFGIVGDGVTDDTAAIQNAIDQLFLNPNNYAYVDYGSAAAVAAGASTRYTLNFAPGVYYITGTLYIPSYATIVGAGFGKTIFSFNPTADSTDPVFQFVNDTSTIGNPATLSSGTASQQPRNIDMRDFSVTMPLGLNTGFQMNAVKDSLFENISFEGNTFNYTTYNSTSNGIVMDAVSSVWTCENNKFKNIKFKSLGTAAFLQKDILNNSFENCYITDCQSGFLLGAGITNTNLLGQQYGPRQTRIMNSKFYKVRKNAVYVELGEYNLVKDCLMIDVGNNNAGNNFAVYPQVFFQTINNSCDDIQSDRNDDLAVKTVGNTSTPYVPEVTGNVIYTTSGIKRTTLSQANPAVQLCRLPVSTDHFGVPAGSIRYTIEYLFKSTTISLFSRKGTISIAADIDQAYIESSDEFDFAGNDSGNTIATQLSFSAVFLDANSNDVAQTGLAIHSIGLYYTNTLSNNDGRLNYSYTAESYFNIG